MKPVSVQRLAEQDILAAIDYYIEHAPNVVERFMKAVDRAMFSIGDSPGIGSPTFAAAKRPEFMPGASPPEVNTAMRFISFASFIALAIFLDVICLPNLWF